MASSMVSSAAAPRAIVARATVYAPFSSVKTAAGFPASRKVQKSNNVGRIKCMKVWPPLGLKKFETLSYLPTLSTESLAKEINYLIIKGWIPCIEFSVGGGYVTRDNHRSPGYYDGRYWTMWKLPMYGCTDPTQVLAEVEENKKEYPDAYIRIIGFDNVRQVQCISFIAYKPPRAALD
ncbi:ribulose-1,5-bisphosphate carboxylase small subunit [Escherichia coli]|nr:ribulose-1,5-bisphosphate carboxylase small subunit [Escherichia coli]